MTSLFTFQTPPGPCGYLPDRVWSLRYEIVGDLTPAEYADRLRAGWRRFGHSLFTPGCPTCTACRSLRVDVARFRPSDTQKRVWKQNVGEVTLTVGEPEATAEKLALYDRFHAAQTERVGWPARGRESSDSYRESFVDNPFAAEEWCYRLGDRLVGVGYVDRLPRVGLSDIYFFHEPELRKRSLGVFNVLSTLNVAAETGLPHVYLGYHVAGCRSLEYKAKYRPNEALESGLWMPFVG